MKPEAQRIAIAEACGWTAIWEACCPPIDYHKMLSWKFEGKITGRTPPDYLNDLNAMHEAWLILDANQRATFTEELAYIVLAAPNDPKLEFVFSRCSLSLFANATAAQRAEAFLKALGLWEEE